MEAPSLRDSAQQQQPQPQPQPQPQSQLQPHVEQQPQPQHLDPLNPQLHQQSQYLQQYPHQPNQNQDYYYQNPAHAYDQSYYSYYQQYPYQNQWQYPQQPQNYAYFHPQPITDQQEPILAVSEPYEGMQTVDASGTTTAIRPVLQQPQRHQQGAYPLVQTSGNTVVPPGMNPAAASAIAALERLRQFAGTMDAAERALAGYPAYNASFRTVSVRPLDAGHTHRGRGRRAGEWVNVGQRNGSAPPRGRGRGRGPRGRGRSRHVQSQGGTSLYSHREPSTTENLADIAENAIQSAPAPEKLALACCELCRVDCTSLEILEQHKSGKRHKKNLRRLEELKNRIKPGEETPNNHETIIDPKPEAAQQPLVAQDIEEQKAAENLPSECIANEPAMEHNPQNDATKLPEVAAETSNQQEKKSRMNKFDTRRHGMKRKMKGGRGGKRVKTSETRKHPIEPPKPKAAIPLICDLCNVKCDTREVLDRHLAGKKHTAKLKRFEGHQAMYGSQGLQVLYPPNPVTQSHFIFQGNQRVGSSAGSFTSQGGSFSYHAQQSTAAGLDPQVPQCSMPQKPEATVTHEANPTAAV